MELRGVVLAESLRPSAAARCLSRARWFLMATAARLMTMTAEWNAAQIFLKIVAAVMILSPISNDESIGCWSGFPPFLQVKSCDNGRKQ